MALLHQVVDLVQLRQADGLEGSLDQATTEEVEGLGGVLTVADVRALDSNHTDDGVEDRSLQVSTSGQTNADNGTARADVLFNMLVLTIRSGHGSENAYLSGLLEGLLAHGEQNDGVGTKAVLGSGLHILDDVGALGEVDESSGAHALAHGLLLIAGIDGDGVNTHSLSVLQGKGAETTTGTNDGNGLTGAHTRLLDTLVDGDTGAEDGSDGGKIAALGYPCNVGGLSDGVLLEGTVDRVAREEGVGAERLVSLLAEVAGKARAVQPLR